jgi:hypothetical protein
MSDLTEKWEEWKRSGEREPVLPNAENNGDPWLPILREVKGELGGDGLERVYANDLLRMLGVEKVYWDGYPRVRLAFAMCRLGWASLGDEFLRDPYRAFPAK